MMATGADIAAEARTWVGTPFRWQASLKGVGCDCKGLVWGVARALALPEAESIYAAVSDYGGRVPAAKLKEGMAATFRRVQAPFELGDVLLLTVAGRAQHLAIYAGDEVVHAFSRGRGAAVTATRTAIALKAWPLDSGWRFGSLTGEA